MTNQPQTTIPLSEDQWIEVIHALYTIRLHAEQHGQVLILDRLRGLLGDVPQLADLIGEPKAVGEVKSA